jgi:predicted nucleotidyltransferase
MIDISINSKKELFSKLDLSRLKPQNTLYPNFWINNNLNTIVSRKLMKIADQIIDSMDIDVEIDDVIITGSIASYNWHDLSDIDLHILFDFTKIDENYDLVKKMLDQSRINWNKTHNITIDGKEVELYFQDTNEEHMSKGIWSLTKEKWIKEPKVEEVEIDLNTTEKKAKGIADNIEHVYELFQDSKFKEAYEYASKIKQKISRMRSTGLSKEGVYSPENLAFKVLRNANMLYRLSSLKIKSYDKMMSVKLESKSKKDFNKSWKKYLS